MPLVPLISTDDQIMKQNTFEKETFVKAHTKSAVDVIADYSQHHKPICSSLKGDRATDTHEA